MPICNKGAKFFFLFETSHYLNHRHWECVFRKSHLFSCKILLISCFSVKNKSFSALNYRYWFKMCRIYTTYYGHFENRIMESESHLSILCKSFNSTILEIFSYYRKQEMYPIFQKWDKESQNRDICFLLKFKFKFSTFF